MSGHTLPALGGSDGDCDDPSIPCGEANWIVVDLFGVGSEPEAGAPYRIYDPSDGGLLATGTLDADGSSGMVALEPDVAGALVEFGPQGAPWVLNPAPVAYDGVLNQSDGESDEAWLQRLSDAKKAAHRRIETDPEGGYAALEDLNALGRSELGLFEDLSLTARSQAEAAEILRRQQFHPSVLEHPGLRRIPNPDVSVEDAFHNPAPWIVAGPDGHAYGIDPSSVEGPSPPIPHGDMERNSRENFLSRMVRVTDDELDYLATRLDDPAAEAGAAPTSRGGDVLGALSDLLVSPAHAQGQGGGVPPGVGRAIARSRSGRAGKAAGRVSASNPPAPRKAAAGKTRNPFVTAKVRRFDVECFVQPAGANPVEFLRQLAEQEATINQTSADALVARREAIVAAGGTKGVRAPSAQSAARTSAMERRADALTRRGVSPIAAEKQTKAEFRTLAATHRLDIIAGGDPRDISGMGDSRVNSSLGGQWKGRRANSLEAYARDMQDNGKGGARMNVKLRRC